MLFRSIEGNDVDKDRKIRRNGKITTHLIFTHFEKMEGRKEGGRKHGRKEGMKEGRKKVTKKERSKMEERNRETNNDGRNNEGKRDNKMYHFMISNYKNNP